MRAQNRRTQSQTGANARRHPNPSISAVSRRLRSTTHPSRRKSGHKSEKRGHGTRIIWSLMMIGGLIASGFVLAQRSQINAHQLRQAEEKFKTQLDDMTNQQRFLVLEKERATNAHESARIAQQAGLGQPQLKKASQTPPPQPLPAKPAPVQPAKLRTDPPKHAASPAAKSAAQPPKSPKLAAKPAAKRAATPASASSNHLKKSPPGAAPAKASKDAKNSRRLAQSSPPSKKEKRR
jgi:hypothetical protein